MMPSQFQQLLEKYSRGECTPAEEKLIDDWYQNIGEKENTFFPEQEKEVMERRMWSAINPQPSVNIRRPLWSVARAAMISLPIFAAIGLYFNRQAVSGLVTPSETEKRISQDLREIYRNEGTSPVKISLADGSTVSLQPASEIIVSKDFGGTTRELQLKGEGFFSVVRDTDRPFLVFTNEVVTRVLGTSFNVRAYDNDGEITVAVKTGKVSVYANKSSVSRQVVQPREVILTPNQQMVYNRQREVISKQLVETPEIVLPNSNLFRMQFENADVAEILDVLQQNYGVEIRFDREVLSNCRLTTSMSDEGLYERISVICKAIGASYVVDDDAAISIKSNGC